MHLHEKEWPAYVDVVLKGKAFGIAILNGAIHADTGIVDDDINLELAGFLPGGGEVGSLPFLQYLLDPSR